MKKASNVFSFLTSERKKCISEASVKSRVVGREMQHYVETFFPTSFEAELKEIRAECEEVKSFVFQVSSKIPSFLPGEEVFLDVLGEGFFHSKAFYVEDNFGKNKELRIMMNQDDDEVTQYFWNEALVGDCFLMRRANSSFTYHPLRDQKHIVGLCDEQGIFPFYLMARSILERKSSFSLTIYYELKEESHRLFYEELEHIMKKCKEVQVHYFFTEKPSEDGIKRSISKEDLAIYPNGEVSYFVNGSLSFYEKMNEILKSLSISNRYIRHPKYQDYVLPDDEREYEIRVVSDEKERILFGKANESLYQTLCKNHFLETSDEQRRALLLKGEVLVDNQRRRRADKAHCYVVLYSSYPSSNLTIQL